MNFYSIIKKLLTINVLIFGIFVGSANAQSALDDPAEQQVEPFQVFDNLYYVGVKWVSAWLLETDQGLILFDSLYGELTDMQSVSFHHQGLALGVEGTEGFLFAVGFPVARRGDAGLHHQRLGPLFTGLQLGAVRSRAEDGKASLAQAIAEARGQGGFGTHHDQVNRLFLADLLQGVLIALTDGQLDAALEFSRAAVAWGHPDLLDASAAGQGPGQGVLPSASSDDQHVLRGSGRGHGGQEAGGSFGDHSGELP